MKLIREKLKNKKIRNYCLILIALFIFATYFMVSLSFQYIGNNASNTNLIIGFVFGLLSVILSSVSTYFIFFKKISNSQLLVGVIIILVSIILSLLSFVFGAIGYIAIK